jgi:hypothetical protein
MGAFIFHDEIHPCMHTPAPTGYIITKTRWKGLCGDKLKSCHTVLSRWQMKAKGQSVVADIYQHDPDRYHYSHEWVDCDREWSSRQDEHSRCRCLIRKSETSGIPNAWTATAFFHIFMHGSSIEYTGGPTARIYFLTLAIPWFLFTLINPTAGWFRHVYLYILPFLS